MVAYYANNYYFPPLMRVGIFAITNISARSITIFAPLIAEWVYNPTFIITGMTFIMGFLSKFLIKYDESDKV
jgi:hypothetical protein